MSAASAEPAATPTVVLVEGLSDRIALESLAARHDRDLTAAGVSVVAMLGITNIRRYVLEHRRADPTVRLAGLYDAKEEPFVRRALAAAAIAEESADPGESGFFRCEADLEDELIRALGLARALAVVAEADEMRSFQLLSQMPAQAGWSRRAVLRRFLGSQGGRKARYARLFVEALPPDTEPAPLRALLDHVCTPGARPATNA